jgi:hypothetical protein
MAKKGYFGLPKNALGFLQEQLMLLQCLKDFLQVFLVLLHTLAEHNDII